MAIPSNPSLNPPLPHDPQLGQIALEKGYLAKISYGRRAIDLGSLDDEQSLKLIRLLNCLGQHAIDKQTTRIALATAVYPPDLQEEVTEIIKLFKKIIVEKFAGELWSYKNLAIDLHEIAPPNLPLPVFEVDEPAKREFLSQGLKKIQNAVFTTQATKYQKGDSIGSRYIYIENKQRGVEPGFEATKDWTKKDDIKLQTPGTTYFKLAREYLNTEVSDDEALRILLDPSAELYQEAKKHVMKNASKFQKRHIVKLDYHEPTAKGVVHIPRERLAHKNVFAREAMYLAKAETIKEKNLGAILEALANDVIIALESGKHPDQQLKSQKLKLIRAEYEETNPETSRPYPKLLLDSTDLGSEFKTLEQANAIKKGQIPGRQIEVGGKKYAVDSQQLASSYVKFLLLGDRDKVGSKGGNIGVILGEDGKASLANIDTGKSLGPKPSLALADAPKRKDYSNVISYLFAKALFTLRYVLIGQTDRMLYENVRSNLTFASAKDTLRDRFAGTFPNYSIFLDTTLSERMAGWKDIEANWEKVKAVFDEYKEAFGPDNVDLDFTAELDEAYKRLEARKAHFEKVLAPRKDLLPEELDLVDNIEKLTSPTTHLAGSRFHPVQLLHLAVKSKTRKEWKMVKDASGQYELSFTTDVSLEATDVEKKLKNYIEGNPTLAIRKDLLKREGNTIKLTFNPDQFPLIEKAFNEETIAAHKRQFIPPKGSYTSK